jgi:hypothetical protein
MNIIIYTTVLAIGGTVLGSALGFGACASYRGVKIIDSYHNNTTIEEDMNLNITNNTDLNTRGSGDSIFIPDLCGAAGSTIGSIIGATLGVCLFGML